jgi:putative endonuclease
MKNPCVYIIANRRNGTIYTGVTSDLIKRIHQHRTQPTGFVAKYACKFLVWFEQHATMENAITREKQLKAGSRKAKLTLIESTNPAWRDLYPEITQ